MKNIITIIVFLLGSVSFGFSQELSSLLDYELSDSVNYFIYNDTIEPLIGVKNKIVIDMEFEKAGGMTEYYLIHQAKILNTDEKIEENNKLYIPYTASSSDLIKLEARVIKKNGEIIDLDKSKVLTSKDEESDVEYKYYAYEGIEKGCVIEFFYLMKRKPSLYGNAYNVQSVYPKYNYDFQFYHPSNLEFAFKSYNDLMDAEKDSVPEDEDQVHWTIKVDTIAGLEMESQSAHEAHLQSFIFTFDKNYYTSKYDLSSYSSVVNTIYQNVNEELSKTEKKVIKKIIAASGCTTARNPHAKVRAIEDYLKKTIQVASYSNPGFTDINFMYTNNIASDEGMIKLYLALFKELDVKSQVVLTCNRFVQKFDKDFESHNFLETYLLYLPSFKEYLEPGDIGSRLGYPSTNLVENYGLFIKEVNVGGEKTPLPKIKYIKPNDSDLNFDNMKLEITLDEDDINNSVMKLERSVAGYNAILYQPYMSYYQPEDKIEMIEAFVKQLNENIEIDTTIVYNDDVKFFGEEPFKVSAEFIMEPFIQNAGSNYIIKVGTMIGPQMEMYQEKERVLPLEIGFNKIYRREIIINVPEGYALKNLEDINIHNEYSEDSEVKMYFKSTYTYENNVLVINCEEYYKMLVISPDLYEEYRAVINSAADFNKISLLVERK